MSCSIAVPTSPSLFCNNMNSLISPPSSPPSSCFRLLKPPIALPAPPSPSVSTSAPSSSSSSPTNSLLKRKRPARLDIPVASLAFGAPATPSAASRDFMEAEGNGFSVYCKRGKREFMEDRYSTAVNLQGKQNQAFFGIFDGHGGAKAAEFAAHNLENNVLKEVIRRSENEDDDNSDGIEEAVKHGYLTTDLEFLKEDVQGGSCCVTALIRNGNLIVSNVGDCRAVLSRGGEAEALTSDHRPSREDERGRIEALGGYVDLCHGVWRIQGSLAVSRGIGDKHLKQWVTAEPETKILKIEDEHDLLILASDGLWDKVTNQEAVDIARSFCVGSDKPQPLLACKKLVELSASRGSFDDISVMVIKLGHYT
ncbi:probable protein phosphatase 2C 25 [Prosopis cineraria]|uniref:probable protein phosphatase 2C 25 n=1 Tax=Prosopis cineraria TaxID=364024 RepID=UPI0024107EC9|nr:probable protein phosphatase 2C 25 [Prosopis cineraria]